MSSITLAHELAFLHRLADYWNIGGRLPFSSHDLACLQALLDTVSALPFDEQVEGTFPLLLDACPCPDCNVPILWTVLNDVRTAWQVHQCPPREEAPLCSP